MCRIGVGGIRTEVKQAQCCVGPHHRPFLFPVTSRMRHLLQKTKRKKPSEPPQQYTSPTNSAKIAAGPSSPRPELAVIPEGE